MDGCVHRALRIAQAQAALGNHLPACCYGTRSGDPERPEFAHRRSEHSLMLGSTPCKAPTYPHLWFGTLGWLPQVPQTSHSAHSDCGGPVVQKNDAKKNSATIERHGTQVAARACATLCVRIPVPIDELAEVEPLGRPEDLRAGATGGSSDMQRKQDEQETLAWDFGSCRRSRFKTSRSDTCCLNSAVAKRPEMPCGGESLQ